MRAVTKFATVLQLTDDNSGVHFDTVSELNDALSRVEGRRALDERVEFPNWYERVSGLCVGTLLALVVGHADHDAVVPFLDEINVY